MAVQVRNLSQLQHTLRRLPESVRHVAVDEIQEAGENIRDRAQLNSQWGPVKRGIRKRRLAKGLNAEVKATSRLSHIEHWGAKSHPIAPENKKALAGDEFGPVAKARHPGIPANPFLANAWMEVMHDFTVRLKYAIRHELRRLAR